MTAHRMNEWFDSGPILAQQRGIPLDDDVTPHGLWQQVRPVLGEVVGAALDQVAKGVPGIAQNDADASYAGFVEPEFSVIDWSRTSAEVHNQVRMFRFMGLTHAPVARIGERWLRVVRTSMTPGEGCRVECADGPIWITESAPAQPPATGC